MSSRLRNEHQTSLRARVAPRVHIAEPPGPPKPPRFYRQRLRIQHFQRRWKNIKQDLPPQLSRRHIGMISIGGVIGTGLFLGSANALKHGGPIGSLLGYSIIGTVVYSLCVSVGEMIAFLPNVGGVIGLADLYVDPAFGFSLGWAAWYNWSVTLPAEITAAAIVVQYWDTSGKIPTAALSGLFLFLATGINCFSSRVYGEFEFWFSTIKVVTIVGIILVCIVLDLGAGSQGPIFFKNWGTPFAASYLGIDGSLGRFLGFWAVLMQACFSFFGSEVPGIAAGEVIDATRNVPRALRKVWIRITLFYLGGIFFAGLLVPANDPRLGSNTQTASSSPFVIAFDKAGVKVLGHIVNAAILLSAWSAAASDVYISSRFLFFLARRGHAPQFLASLIRHPWDPSHDTNSTLASTDDEDDDDDDVDSDDERLRPEIAHPSGRGPTGFSIREISLRELERAVPLPDPNITSGNNQEHQDQFTKGDEGACEERVEVHDVTQSPHSSLFDEPALMNEKQPYLVLPLYAVLFSASVGLLSFLGSVKGNTAQVAFNWLVSVASVASLQSWAGILFTYIRWHAGTVYAENQYKEDAESTDSVRHAEAKKVIEQIKTIKIHRHWGQPYLAWYAFAICMAVVFTNGWSVFVHSGWRIAVIPDQPVSSYGPDARESAPVSIFLSSYIPLPFFLLLTFGYKLIYQTKMVRLDEMSFSREGVPPLREDKPRSGLLRWLLVI